MKFNMTGTNLACRTTESTCDYSEVETLINMKVSPELVNSVLNMSSTFKVIPIVSKNLAEPSWQTDFHGVCKFPLSDATDFIINAFHEGVDVREVMTTDESLQSGKQKKI